jgi:hypothetical protein
MVPNPTILADVPSGLSNLLSAYDDAHWETVVAELKGASGVLARGSVLSAVAADAGKLTLTSAGSEASAFGVLLDEVVDTGVTYSDGSVSCSVARAGSFRGPALIVGVGTNGITLSDRLRDQGIYVHGPISVPTAEEAEASAESEPPSA